MNSSGKVLVVFLVITAFLLISITAISLFYFRKEIERRELAEVTLEKYKTEKLDLEESLKAAKKENFLLQEKNKEADARVDDLTDELELEKGLREEMKRETAVIKEELEKMKAEKATFTKSIDEKEGAQDRLQKNLTISEQRVKELESQLKAEIERSQKLGKLYEQGQEQVSQLSKTLSQGVDIKQTGGSLGEEMSDDGVIDMGGIELGEIVVIPDGPKSRKSVSEFFAKESTAPVDTILDGRILSVDIETEFVIVGLGENHGLTVGDILSVYRKEKYLGDIKITRLQSEMSAADLVLPLLIQNVKKNDQVKTKQ